MGYFEKTPIRYRTVLLMALLLATLFLLQSYLKFNVWKDLRELDAFNWWREMPVPYLNFLFWALLLPLVYMGLQRWPLSTRPMYRMLLIQVPLSIGIGALHEVTTSAIYYSILHQAGELEWSQKELNWAVHALFPAIVSRMLEYWVLVGLLTAVDNYREYKQKQVEVAQLEGELRSAQLSALRKQLQPHFLFNTLNTVSSLMDESVTDARKVLAQLGQLLRVSLNKDQRNMVPLEQEIDNVENYLGIEAMRFRDRLSVTFDVDTTCRAIQVPFMIMQPLVENAVKHGPDGSSDPVQLHVSAWVEGGRLMLSVKDNGQGMKNAEQALAGPGIGLKNVRDRLRILYGDAALFEIRSEPGKGAEIRIGIPTDQSTQFT